MPLEIAGMDRYPPLMMRSWTVARVSGIDVRLHPTFAFVFLWVLIDWRRVGAGNGGSSIAFSVILVLLIFTCVLLHEFGHAFMARQHGVRVHDVSLSAIGGVARMEQLPEESRAEVLIALSGPAANLAFIIAMAPIVLLAGVVSGFSSLEDYATTVFEPSPIGLLTTLLYANVLIIVFNVLPAFPMDGGRVFRAALTSAVGREMGTRIAVVVGQAFAVVLLLFSIFVAQSVILVLLSVFVIVVAYGEERAVRVESAMRRMRVGQFALWDSGGIGPNQPLTNALRGGLRDITVTEGGRVVGVLWRNRLLAELGRTVSGRTVGDVMERDPITVDIDMPIYDVHQLMEEQDLWAVPVIESGMYRGIFTGDRFLHIYSQLSPDPVQAARHFIERRLLARLRA
ncbi:MAG: site-2 protease family protein [Chloroflexi bacterium]|nr:site-2 protease family protein [Chloroflexota bacterium]